MDTDDVAGLNAASTKNPLPLDPMAEHPPIERLAALADEAPTTHEVRHLAACAMCAAEVDGYRSLLGLARAERDRLGEPLSSWESLEASLRSEGLLASPSGSGARRALRISAGLRNGVAAALLVAIGGIIGRVTNKSSAGTPPATGLAAGAPTLPKPDRSSIGPDPIVPVGFQNRDEAINAVLTAEKSYRHAVAYLMLADSADRGEGIPYDYRTRLAVLDEVARTTQAALYAAPNDQVLKSFYLNSVNARERTLRQIDKTVPTGLQVGKY